MKMTTEIYIDGASKQNNIKNAIRKASICVMVPSQNNYKLVGECGNLTNNEAEWNALVQALSWAILKDETNLKIYSDSQLVVNQFNGLYQCKNPDLVWYLDCAKKLVKEGNLNVELVWIPREKNLAGIELERIG